MKINLMVVDASPEQIAAIIAIGGVTLATGGYIAPQGQPFAVPSSPALAVPQTTTPAAAPVASGPLDSRGFPWDERIHSTNKATNADGSWRYRRNTSKEVIASVEAALKPAPVFAAAAPIAATQAAPVFTPPAPAPVFIPPFAAPPLSTAVGPVDPGVMPAFLQRPPAPTAAQAIAALSAPQGQPVYVPATYDQVIALMTDALQNSRMPPDGVPAFFASIGITGVNELQNNQPALDKARDKLTAL